MNRKNAAFDIDGVFGDFGTQFLDTAERKGLITTEERHLPVTDWDDYRFRTHWDHVVDSDEFWLGIQPLVDPKQIQVKPKCYITARPIPSEITKRWLDMHGFHDAPVITVGVDGDKMPHLIENDIGVFVEDNYHNWLQAHRAGILAYLVSRPHNMKYFVWEHLRLDSIADLRI